MRARLQPRQFGGIAITVAGALMLAASGEASQPESAAGTSAGPVLASVMPVTEALSRADIPALDPATMKEAEIQEVLGTQSVCEFRYTSSGRPVAAAAPAAGRGVVKLNGVLVGLEADMDDGRFVLAAEPVRLTVTPEGELRAGDLQAATALFEISDRLKVGYAGYALCRDAPD